MNYRVKRMNTAHYTLSPPVLNVARHEAEQERKAMIAAASRKATANV